MVFALIVILAVYPLRRLGWSLSKELLYRISIPLSVIITVVWGSFIALGVHFLIRWQDPNIIVRIIFGFGFGSYLSIPNFALFSLSSLPMEELKRTERLYISGLLAFIVSSIVFAFWLDNLIAATNR